MTIEVIALPNRGENTALNSNPKKIILQPLCMLSFTQALCRYSGISQSHISITNCLTDDTNITQ